MWTNPLWVTSLSGVFLFTIKKSILETSNKTMFVKYKQIGRIFAYSLLTPNEKYIKLKA